MVLEYGVSVDGHPLREFLEVTNHAEAFDTLTELTHQQITYETVLLLHDLEACAESTAHLLTLQHLAHEFSPLNTGLTHFNRPALLRSPP